MLLRHAKVEGTKSLTSRITSRISKLLEECSQIIWGGLPLIHPRFVITDFRWYKKIKKIELEDRRMTLFHEKVGGKTLVCPLANMLGGPSSRSSQV